MSVIPPADSPYDATPDEALDAIAAYSGPVLVDLDETLYLGNSTEDFINQARPGLAALLLLRVLDLLRPWRWSGGETTRDVWRVRLVWTLFPWTRRRWRHAVSGHADQYGNQPLIAALRRRNTAPVIVTAGFQPVVTPLVAALGFADARIVAARLDSFEDRRLGKLHNATRSLGRETVGASLLVTDSLDDLDMLRQCARPIRTVWPEARFRRALGHIYLPGEYVARVKRPGERYILRVILLEDLAFWILASMALAPHPLMHIAGLASLLLSFWCIYERGYVDNDGVAARFEHNPKLSKAYWDAPVATPRWRPWIWALLSAALAIYLLRWPRAAVAWPADLARWTGVLLGTFGCFKLYNRLNKSTRVWLFALLQMARSTAFLALVPVGAAGAIGLGAHGLSRWVPYYIYRLDTHKNWPKAQPQIMRILFFVLLIAVVGISRSAPVFTWTTLMLLLYSLYRARVELRVFLGQIHRIDRNHGNGPP